jgi:hypothetical protein
LFSLLVIPSAFDELFIPSNEYLGLKKITDDEFLLAFENLVVIEIIII